MTEVEAADLGILLRRVSIALRETVGCTKTYVAQFAEAAGHQHVHFHVVPRMADQPDDHRGPNIFKYLGASDADRLSEARMNEIATVIRRVLIAQETVTDQKQS
jgi:diadenosine tetraphosphate (Ap4A) HIT family hydrolase